MRAKGAMRVGKNGHIVPDASSERPLILSNKEMQPLCEPDVLINPAHPLEVMEGYSAHVLAHVQGPRKVVIDTSNHVLMTSKEGLVSIRMDNCGNTDIKTILPTDLEGDQMAYGLSLYDGHLYVSTANAVWRYSYTDGQHSPLAAGVKVVTNIRGAPDLDVAIDPFGHAFIPRAANTDGGIAGVNQAIIKRFNFRTVPSDGYDFEEDGEIFAFGTNVHGGMAFDAQARLWGIDAPYPAFERSDLGGRIAPQGLAEEINLYEFPYKNYGYPYCFTEYDLKPFTDHAKGKGAQWGHPSQMNESINLDAYCEQDKNNRRPAVPLAPNTAASAMYFFMGTWCSVGDRETLGTSVGMPCNWTDTPIVAYRGHPGQPQGHYVAHLPFDDLGHVPRWDKSEEVILKAAAGSCDIPESNCLSPAGLAIDKFGRLLVTSETTNEIILVKRNFNERATTMLTEKFYAQADAEASLSENGEEGEST
ncbi:hypothetical protein BX666DRAFT_1850289 [Dichotomocladium elegans]|nr:hypothetical protein BX666DRAFT_1850289 [Dichotomocladium elegans]